MNLFSLFIDVFSEGKVTEPRYLQDFAQAFNKDKAKVVIKSAGCSNKDNLIKFVTDAIEWSQILTHKDHKRSIWIIFDKDQHTDIEINQALALVSRHNASCTHEHKKIHTVCSNPCVEIWALAHFLKKGPFPDTASGCSKLLEKHMPTYEHPGNPVFDMKQMDIEKYLQARNLANSWSKTSGNDCNICPYTNIYELLELIKNA